MIGEITAFAFAGAPDFWLACDGRQLNPNRNNQQALFSLIGTQFGAAGGDFKLPDFRGRTPIGAGQHKGSPTNYGIGEKGGSEIHTLTPEEMPAHNHPVSASAAAATVASPEGALWGSSTGKTPFATERNELMKGELSYTGDGQAHENMSPFVAINYSICDQGIYPNPEHGRPGFVGEIVMFAGGYAPEGNWVPCDGRLFSIAQNTSLFSILGDTYGGNGTTTFAIPDLRGMAALGAGKGPGLSERELGSSGGSATVTLTVDQMPSHDHTAMCTTQPGNDTDPNSATWATAGETRGGVPIYSPAGETVAMNMGATAMVGGGKEHNNMPPYLPVQYIICVEGEYPPRG